jgi:hypothetical protein
VLFALQVEQFNVSTVSVGVRGQHCSSAHAVVTGANILPSLAGKNINETLIPAGLNIAHVAHVSGESIGMTLPLPDMRLKHVIERFMHIVEMFVFFIPKHLQIIFDYFVQNFRLSVVFCKYQSAMSLPLEQLYHYINQCAQESWGDRVIIYRFYPHGSKDLKNLSFLTDYEHDRNLILCPQLYCNDQEPLDFERYDKETFLDKQDLEVIQAYHMPKANLRDYPENIWKYAILLHSEQRSKNLISYQNSKFITAYYWSHAVISRDWFRAAEHVLVEKRPSTCMFLVYNRAWAGTREYRMRFADLLIDHDLVNSCRMTVNTTDPELGMQYHDHEFKNPVWKPQHRLEDYFASKHTTSCYSAKVDLDDYAQTHIEVVLETLFDDDRLHLTEKILRPIACGQPFLLVATPGSLEYLKSYGFQTYSEVWSEEYDHIQDPLDRLQTVVSVMQHIQHWDSDQRSRKLQQAQEIADFNRQHFFSRQFIGLVESELQTNLDQAFAELRHQHISQYWLQPRDQIWHITSKLEKSMLGRLSQQDWDYIVDRVIEINQAV